MFNKKRLCLAVTAAVATQAPSFALAQGPTLEEVVVTASRRAESVQDIPFNVSAINEDSLTEAGITRPEDLAKRIAGVSVIDGGARFRNSLTIRGIGAPGASSSDFFTTEATSYYVGETPMENLNLRIKDVERMEVLRGPQGTLYGGGAMGGTVRYILNRPDPEEFHGKVATRISDIDGADDLSTDTEIILNIPVTDNFAIRAVGNYLDEAGYIDYVTFPDKVSSGALPEIGKEDYNTEETWMGRIAARWLANDAWDLELSYTAQDQDSQGRQGYSNGSVDVFGDPIDTDFVNKTTIVGYNDDTANREISLMSFDAKGDLGFAELTLHASHYEDDYNTQGDVTRFLEGLYVGYYPEFEDFNAWNDNEINSETDTLELRLQSVGDSDFDWVTGWFYTQQDREWNLLEYTPGLNEFFWGEGTSVPPNDFNLESEGDYSQWAIYFEGTWHITDQLDVTLGIRHFDMEDEIDMHIWYPIYDGLDDYDDRNDPCFEADTWCFRDNSKGDYDDQFYKLNLAYQFNDDVMGYFTYSEGFRRGGANAASAAQADPEVQDLIEEARFYEPDTLDNYELGFKSTLMDGRMTLNGAIYYIEWQDIQRMIGTVVSDDGLTEFNLPIDQRVNAGDAISQGAEIELSAQLSETLRMDASVGVNRIEADGDGPYQEDGEEIPGKPEKQASVALNGDYNLDNGLEWGWYAALAYRDEVPTGNSLFPELSSYTLLDASVSLQGDQWTVSVFGDNLTDEEYETSFSSSEFRNTVYTGRPRTLGVRLSYDF